MIQIFRSFKPTYNNYFIEVGNSKCTLHAAYLKNSDNWTNLKTPLNILKKLILHDIHRNGENQKS